MVINRQCPTYNRLWTTTQFPPFLPQCLECSQKGAKKKPSQFKILRNEAGLIFRSALEWDTRIEDVALSLDDIKRCLTTMLVVLDGDTPQIKGGLEFPLICTAQDSTMTQEPLWLWIYVKIDQDWEKVDDEDCWGVNYTEPMTEIKEKFESILLTWGGKHPEEEEADMIKPNPERERFSVSHAVRDPEILKDRKLENEDIFEIIRNPPDVGATWIFKKPDLTAGFIKAVNTQVITTIHLPSGPLSLDGAQWHLLKHTLTNSEPKTLGASIQNELTRQLMLDKDKKHRSFSWKLLRTVKGAFLATKYQGGTEPFFKNAMRGKERIWAEEIATPQPMVINWSGLDDKEKLDLTPTLSETDN